MLRTRHIFAVTDYVEFLCLVVCKQEVLAIEET